MGEVLRYIPFAPVLTQAPLAEGTQGQAWDQYLATKEKAKGELGALEQRMAQTDPEKAKIMAAHQEILADPAMDDEIRGLVMEQLCSPDAAIAQIYDTYAAILAKSKNALMRERASDLQDVKRRLLRCWAGAPEQNLSSLAKPVIVVADDLFPSDTASLDRARVLGIVTQVGGSTSHTAIIARSYEIPAVLGVTGAMDALADGQFIVLDAVEGRVIPNPTEEEITRYSQQAAQLQAELQITKAYRDKLPVTLDGHRVEVHLNVAAATEQELAGAAFADGCGLFRTEFLYTSSQGLPDETQQFQIYKKVLTAFGDKPVTLRTMDIGGDKQVPCLDLPKESNPFLGGAGPKAFPFQAGAVPHPDPGCPAGFRPRQAANHDAHGGRPGRGIRRQGHHPGRRRKAGRPRNPLGSCRPHRHYGGDPFHCFDRRPGGGRGGFRQRGHQRSDPVSVRG